jgi:transketolase
MALEDLAMMRAVHGSTVLYPSDATSAAALVRPWPTGRASATCAPPAAPTRSCTTPGRVPGRRVQGAALERRDQVTLIGAGVTLHECLAAADQLATDGISARVIDLYSVKPADTATLAAAAAATGGGWSSPRTTTPRAASAPRSSTP